jgi:hypothetical protein
MKEILTPQGVRKQIADTLGYSLPFIRACLRGKRDNLHAQKIRRMALQNGGVERTN